MPSFAAVRITRGRPLALLGFAVALACGLLLILSHTSVHATSGGDPYATPGSTFLYKFTVTRPGMFWYHPHHDSSAE